MTGRSGTGTVTGCSCVATESADVLRLWEPLSLLELRGEEGEPGRVY